MHDCGGGFCNIINYKFYFFSMITCIINGQRIQRDLGPKKGLIFFPIPMVRANFGSVHTKGIKVGSPATISGFEITANGRTSRSDA